MVVGCGIRTQCSGTGVRKVQHFQGCSAFAFVSIDVGVFVESEGELAESLYVTCAGHVECDFSLVVGIIDPTVRIHVSLVI
jgi:hypothetical protein